MEQTLEADFAQGRTENLAGDVRSSLTVRSSSTVEHLFYLCALLVAFGLRFINLGEAPLAPLEATQAWPAWLAATMTHVANAPAPTSALLYGMQSWLFFIAGASDTLARLLPALVGTALVLLPWWWRSWLGRGGALVVAWLLAVDPWLIALSRTSDGAMLTIGLGLLAFTAIWNWLASPSASIRAGQDDLQFYDGAALPLGGQASPPASERTLVVSLALLLVSGPLAWSWLPVLGAFAWYCTRVAARRRYATFSRSTWLWFGAALLLGASGGLAWPSAFGAVGSSFSVWLAQWGGAQDSGLGAGWPLLRLAVDQPLLLVFGPLGLILLATGRAAVQPRQLALFLVLATVWGLVLVFLPGRSAFVLPMLGLPLAISAGLAIAYLLSLPLDDVGGLELTVLIAVAAILLVAGSIWLAMAVESVTYDSRVAITAVALAVLTAAIWLIFGFWAGWRLAGKVAGLFFAAVLLLVSVRSGWLLNQVGSRMAPDGLFAVTTLPEARLLPGDVQRISSIRNGDPYEAPVQVATGGRAPDALVGWLLRDMRRLVWVTAPDPAAQPLAADGSARIPLIVAPVEMEQDRGLGGMIGAEYPLTMRWVPAMLPSLPPPDPSSEGGLPAEELARLRGEQAWSQATRPQLEWLLYRAIRNEPAVDSVTLWATP